MAEQCAFVFFCLPEVAGGRQESTTGSHGISWTTSSEGKPKKQEDVKEASLKRLKDLHNEKVLPYIHWVVEVNNAL